MTTHDELRKLAEAAEPWMEDENNIYLARTDAAGITVCHRMTFDSVRSARDQARAKFIAAATPETIRALLDELDTKNDQIQALQRAVAAKDVALDIAAPLSSHGRREAMRDRIEQIRAAHANARPRLEDNPAWFHSENDIGVLLQHIDQLKAQRDELLVAAMRKVKRDRMIRPIKERAKGTPLKSMEPQCVEEWRAALATAPEHPTGRAGQ